MVYSIISLSLTFFILAVGLAFAARFFSKREDTWIAREEQWREREKVLVDRLLGQARVAPVEIQREQVIKLPDPEIQPPSWIDESFMLDEVKEELEQIYPEVSRMSHTQAQQLYAHDWGRIAKRLKEEQTPLRAQ